jgi:hypothetical protein
MLFLVTDTQVQGVLAWAGLAVCVVAFYLNHRFSYRYNREREAGRVPNIGSIMFFPYVRIIPMHLMIVAGSRLKGNSGKGLMVFLLLKTVADVAMHVIGHVMARAAAQRARDRLS